MYLEMGTEEDKKMVESWKADADGILIFVRLYRLLCSKPVQIVIDRFILCCRCVVDLSVDSRYSTEPTGRVQFLPREHISGSFRPKSIHPFYFPTPIFSTKLCRLGKRTLVLEFSYQSYLCFTRDPVTTMGTKISQGHSVAICSSQASSNPCVPC